MRIAKDTKLGVALEVLRRVAMNPCDIVIDMYSNCREQGFFLTSYHKSQTDYLNRRAVSFAENRRSDHIIVQFGNQKDFNEYGVISEEKYSTNKKYFECGDSGKAGKFIAQWLKGTE